MIHKSQELTLELIIIELVDAEFAAGLTYVVLSRVKKRIYWSGMTLKIF